MSDKENISIDLVEDYPEVLADLVEHLTQRFIQRGRSEAEAADLALDCAECIRGHWGGQLIYVPKGRLVGLSARDREIWRRFNGQNLQELCREYGIGRVRLYQIIKAMREEEVRKRQGRLF